MQPFNRQYGVSSLVLNPSPRDPSRAVYSDRED